MVSEMSAAASALMAGRLVAFPTETVYGLGADAQNQTAVSRIYSVKGRPTNHPLIVHVASLAEVHFFARNIPDYALALAKKYWPGPMTLILPRTENAKDFVTGGQESVGVRIPNHPVALDLLREFEALGGHGIAAPSANRFGQVSPTTPQAVRDELEGHLSQTDLILEGGSSQVGIESTIIDCTGAEPKILRPGFIIAEMVQEATGQDLATGDSSLRVSGSMESHYAPRAKVVLNSEPAEGDGFIAKAEIPTPAGVIRLASPTTDEEFAQLLYSSLRAADELNLATVVVQTPEGAGLAIAIRDRLEKASRGR
jgi:L-threonylcarbamoyladenylate synthase